MLSNALELLSQREVFEKGVSQAFTKNFSIWFHVWSFYSKDFCKSIKY